MHFSLTLFLISSQLSTISGTLNGVATLFTNDIYESLLKRKASDKEVLLIARIMTVLVGVFMIVFAYFVPIMGGFFLEYGVGDGSGWNQPLLIHAQSRSDRDDLWFRSPFRDISV